MLTEYRMVFLFWCVLVPFYYLPEYFASARAALTFEDETFWLRAGKDVVLLALFGVWFLRLVAVGRFLRPSPGMCFLTGYVGLGLVHVIAAPTLASALLIVRTFVEYVGVFFVARDLFKTQEQVWRLLVVLVVPSGLVSAFGFIEYYLGGINLWYTLAAGQPRIISTLYNPNNLGWYLAFVNGVILGLAGLTQRRALRCLLGSLFATNTATLVLSGSRSGLVGLVVAVAIFLVAGRRGRVAFPVLGLLVFIATAWMEMVRSEIEELRILSGVDYGLILRSERVTDTWAQVFRTPGSVLWGVGSIESVGVEPAYMNVLYAGGVLGAVLIGSALLALGVPLFMRKHRMGPWLLPVSVPLAVCAVMALFGNVLFVFPVGMFFWMLAGVADRFAIGTVSLSERRRPVSASRALVAHRAVR